VNRPISPTAAMIVILLALLIFSLVFSRAEWAPEEKRPFRLPPEPSLSETEVTQSRRGLKPLGIVGVLPPLKEDRRKGVRVAVVVPGSVADRAGIQMGDLIVSFGGQKLQHPLSLVGALNNAKAGREYEAVVIRDGKEQKLTITGIIPLPPEERPHRL